MGERVLELPERGVADAVVVGRARDAHVQVPSVSVGPHHCALFVHEGQWVVQDIGGLTKLNGRPVSGPTTLNIGDRVQLGDDASPPSLEIDPLGASEGRSGPARTPGPTVVYLSSAGPRKGGAVPTSMPRPAPVLQPSYAPPPVHSVPAGEDSIDPPNPDYIDWSPAQEAPYRARATYAARKPRRASRARRGILFICGILALAGTAIFTYRRMHPPVKVPVASPRLATTVPAEVEDDTPNLHSKLFDGTTADPAPSATGSQTGSASSPLHPRRPDETWDDVVAHHFEVTRQGSAIIAFDEYRRLHPGQFEAQLDRYTDDAVDWLWWQRIDQLIKQRTRLAGQIRDKKQDIRAQPAGAFHETLVKEAADLQAQLDKVVQILADEMGYTDQPPPDLENPARLKELARSRDPDRFARFKTRILAYVRSHQGQVPWEGD